MPLAPVGPLAGIAGLAVMIAVRLTGPLSGRPLLTHLLPAGAHVPRILGVDVHTPVAFDLGIALLVFGTLVSLLELLSRVAERRTE